MPPNPPLIPRLLSRSRTMSTAARKPIYFADFEVSSQVFYTTPRSYALVNIKPILPGHVLVVPFRRAARLTDLSPEEVTDLFCAVQKVQRMLARRYFSKTKSTSPSSETLENGNENGMKEEEEKEGKEGKATPEDGSFNVALQDGIEAGQTVAHVHVHIIPRMKEGQEDVQGDAVYALLQGERGNVGGGFWDRGRPVQRGMFPRIEDKDRMPRAEEDMVREAEGYRALMAEGEDYGGEEDR